MAPREGGVAIHNFNSVHTLNCGPLRVLMRQCAASVLYERGTYTNARAGGYTYILKGGLSTTTPAAGGVRTNAWVGLAIIVNLDFSNQDKIIQSFKIKERALKVSTKYSKPPFNRT